MLAIYAQAILVALTLLANDQFAATVDLTGTSDTCPSDGVGRIVRESTYIEGHGGQQPMPPLEVVLVRMNREEYRAGDPLVFDVTIKNRSETPQRIPTLPRGAVCDELDPSKPEQADAKIQLRLKSPSGKSQLVSVATLWGASKRKDSWAILEPGQTALIRVSKEWMHPYFPGGIPDRIEAFLTLERPGTMRIESSNSVPIRMAP